MVYRMSGQLVQVRYDSFLMADWYGRCWSSAGMVRSFGRLRPTFISVERSFKSNMLKQFRISSILPFWCT
jgi:hypothetical protein